jgi:transcriptional regulator GlxA family with amidase domain
MKKSLSKPADLTFPLFLQELNNLLWNSGITPFRLPVTAGSKRTENKFHSSPESGEIVGRVILLLEEHLTDSPSLKQLADEVRLSKYQLIRRFREETGVTPWQYLIGKRIEKARELLEEGVPPGQVAVESGFYDQSHLTRTFREELGTTPKEYQEENFRNRN